MKIYITYFYNVRFFKPNMIPISTALWDPVWYHAGTHNQNKCFIDKNGVMNGIREESLALPEEKHPEEMCQHDCPFKSKVPYCQFLEAYYKHLKSLDFKRLLLEFQRVADDVKKITHYEGGPEIVLLVHEKPDNPCSERAGLIQLFKDNNIDLKEWTADKSGIIF